MFGLTTNPWFILAVVVGLIGSHGLVGYRAYQWATATAEVDCQKRINKINEKIEEQNREIERVNGEWEKKIADLQDRYNTDLAAEESIKAELEKRIADYEESIASNSDCTISGSDVDRVRRK